MTTLTFSNVHRVDPDNLYKENIYNYVQNQVENIERNFLIILSKNILPKSETSVKKHLDSHLKFVSEKMKYSDKFITLCALEFKNNCHIYFKNIIYSLNQISDNSKELSKLAHLKNLKNSFSVISKESKLQSINLQAHYFDLMKNKSKLTPDYTYSLQLKLRNINQNSIDRILALSNKYTRGKFRTFINSFLLPINNILADHQNFPYLSNTIKLLDRSLYDFSFYMDKLEIVSKETKRRAGYMKNQWNLVHKHLARK